MCGIIKSISDSYKTAMCQKARCKARDAQTFTCDGLLPTTEGYGKEFRMRIEGNGLRGSYPFTRTDDDKRLGGFTKVTKDRIYEQTNSMFGH